MTLKYGQGHRKWYEQVKLNTSMQKDQHALSVWKKCNLKVFATSDIKQAGKTLMTTYSQASINQIENVSKKF